MAIKKFDSVQDARKIATELARLLYMNYREEVLPSPDSAITKELNDEFPKEFCPRCKSNFHVENPDSIICPMCGTDRIRYENENHKVDEGGKEGY